MSLSADTSILQPLAVLALFTMAILMLIPLKRIQQMRLQKLTDADFKAGESDRVPEEARIANRNYMNLLELPVLFYVAGLIIFTTNQTDSLFLTLAWAYVGLRFLHSLVHLSYNQVTHRFLVFAASNFALLAIWLRISLNLFA